jgi:hypothetical protein
MLHAAECANMLSRLLTDVNAQPVVLIAYQRSNIPGIQAVFDTSAHEWKTLLKKKGFLFVQRVT